MILNTYAVLLVFAAGVRLVFAGLVLRLAVSPRSFALRPAPNAEDDRLHLLYLLAVLLAGLGLASWPLLYLLLQSYVETWPGVMCVYGVTQVGAGSRGAARYLPDLVRLLQLTRPAVVFAGGAWLVLYRLNRETRYGPLLGRLWLAAIPLGVLATADAAADLAYVGIPKREEFAEGGCCTVLHDAGTGRFLPRPLVGAAGRPALIAAYYALNLGLGFALLAATRRPGSAPGPLGLGALMLGGAATGLVSAGFLVEVAAPALLGLPHHQCPYDLIPDFPEAVVAIGLFVAGSFCLGWACVARWAGAGPSTAAILPRAVHGLLRLALGGYAGSLAMISLEWALA